MTYDLPPLVVSRCGSCHDRFLPRPGPCPRCGSSEVAPEPVPPYGEVLAATELLSPSAGWASPHRLALVGLEEEVRILALVEGDLPAIGATIGIVLDNGRYVARSGRPPKDG